MNTYILEPTELLFLQELYYFSIQSSKLNKNTIYNIILLKINNIIQCEYISDIFKDNIYSYVIIIISGILNVEITQYLDDVINLFITNHINNIQINAELLYHLLNRSCYNLINLLLNNTNKHILNDTINYYIYDKVVRYQTLGYNNLLLKCCSGGTDASLNYLLENNVNINVFSEKLNTPLITSVINKKYYMVKQLLQYNNINIHMINTEHKNIFILLIDIYIKYYSKELDNEYIDELKLITEILDLLIVNYENNNEKWTENNDPINYMIKYYKFHEIQINNEYIIDNIFVLKSSSKSASKIKNF